MFLIVSSATVIVPPALLYLAPSTRPILGRIEDRVFRNRHQITFWVLFVVGTFLVVRSATRLL